MLRTSAIAAQQHTRQVSEHDATRSVDEMVAHLLSIFSDPALEACRNHWEALIAELVAYTRDAAPVPSAAAQDAWLDYREAGHQAAEVAQNFYLYSPENEERLYGDAVSRLDADADRWHTCWLSWVQSLT
jgi:hypothetical protein